MNLYNIIKKAEKMQNTNRKQIRHFLFYLALSLFAAGILLIAVVMLVFMGSYSVDIILHPEQYQEDTVWTSDLAIETISISVLGFILSIVWLVFGIRKAKSCMKQLKANGEGERIEKKGRRWLIALLTVATALLFLFGAYVIAGIESFWMMVVVLAIAGLIFGVPNVVCYVRRLKSNGEGTTEDAREEKFWRIVLLTIGTVLLFLIGIFLIVAAIGLMPMLIF